KTGVSREDRIAGVDVAKRRTERVLRVGDDREASDIRGVVAAGVGVVEQTLVHRVRRANGEHAEVGRRVRTLDGERSQTANVLDAGLVVLRRFGGRLELVQADREGARAGEFGLEDVTLEV